MRKLYWVTLSYDMPVTGTVQILAESPEEAVKVLTEAHQNMRNFTVIKTQELTENEIRMLGIARQEQPPYDEFNGTENKVLN